MEHYYKKYANPATGDTLTIFRDECPPNPRTDYDCNIGAFIVPRRCSYVSSEYDFPLDFSNRKKDVNTLEKSPDIVAYLPVYVYDHSGVCLNTTGFSCPWDSGQIGWIVATRETLKRAGFINWKRITAKRRSTIENWLRAEVETFSAYLSGDVYGFTVESASGEETDACWGYFGDDGLKVIQDEYPDFTEELA